MNEKDAQVLINAIFEKVKKLQQQYSIPEIDKAFIDGEINGLYWTISLIENATYG